MTATKQPLPEPITAYAWVFRGKGLDPKWIFAEKRRSVGFGGTSKGRVVPVRIVPIDDAEATEVEVSPPRRSFGAKPKLRASEDT